MTEPRSKRRGRGEGTVWQNTNGLWVGQVSHGIDGSGKRRRRAVTAGTKRELLEKLRESQQAKTTTDAGNMTVAQYLDGYMSRRRRQVAPETHRRECSLLTHHVVPHLGRLRLRTLEPVHVIEWYSAMEEAKASPSTRHKAGVALGTALKEAVSLKLLANNPVRDIRKPRVEKPDIEILTESQVRTIIDEAYKEHFHACYVLALTSGARPGELFALAWPDVDFLRGTVSITKSLEEVNGKLRIKTTKTKASRRTVTLPKTTLDILAEHREFMLAEGLYRADIMFPTRHGSYVRKSNFHRRHWKPMLESLGLPDVTFHACRHTHATLLLKAGESPKVIAERLGHASIKTTLDLYSHVVESMERQAADKLEVMFGKPMANR